MSRRFWTSTVLVAFESLVTFILVAIVYIVCQNHLIKIYDKPEIQFINSVDDLPLFSVISGQRQVVDFYFDGTYYIITNLPEEYFEYSENFYNRNR